MPLASVQVSAYSDGEMESRYEIEIKHRGFLHSLVTNEITSMKYMYLRQLFGEIYPPYLVKIRIIFARSVQSDLDLHCLQQVRKSRKTG